MCGARGRAFHSEALRQLDTRQREFPKVAHLRPRLIDIDTATCQNRDHQNLTLTNPDTNPNRPGLDGPGFDALPIDTSLGI